MPTCVIPRGGCAEPRRTGTPKKTEPTRHPICQHPLRICSTPQFQNNGAQHPNAEPNETYLCISKSNRKPIATQAARTTQIMEPFLCCGMHRSPGTRTHALHSKGILHDNVPHVTTLQRRWHATKGDTHFDCLHNVKPPRSSITPLGTKHNSIRPMGPSLLT